MAVVTVVMIHLFVASVVDRVGDSALNGLGKDLLDLLGNDGGVTAVLSVCLGGGLVGLSAGGVNLRACQLFYSMLQSSMGEHTLSGRASSRPEGAASWTFPGTAESPVAWDLPCPYSLVEDILMLLRKTGVVRTVARVKVRNLSAVDMMMN
jgi:hypothetical protein